MFRWLYKVNLKKSQIDVLQFGSLLHSFFFMEVSTKVFSGSVESTTQANIYTNFIKTNAFRYLQLT